jgi:hypothetical protein
MSVLVMLRPDRLAGEAGREKRESGFQSTCCCSAKRDHEFFWQKIMKSRVKLFEYRYQWIACCNADSSEMPAKRWWYANILNERKHTA